MIQIVPSAKFRSLLFFVVVVMLVAVSGAGIQAQRKGARGASPAAAQEPTPSFQEYRGVQLGMLADDVRKKLGEPKEKGDEQDFFVFDETETAQIVYDKTHKVIAISADFTSPSPKVLTATQVLGAEIEAKPDGSAYKMVRYPKAGFWLSYNRTGGVSPLTSVTLQKIQ